MILKKNVSLILHYLRMHVVCACRLFIFFFFISGIKYRWLKSRPKKHMIVRKFFLTIIYSHYIKKPADRQKKMKIN
jgi:hypothetical protein